jgi:hypothetical protein
MVGTCLSGTRCLHAASGQLADLPRGVLQFEPAMPPPLVLPFFLLGVVGQIGWSVTEDPSGTKHNYFNLNIHLGELHVRTLSINGHAAPTVNILALNAGEAIRWNATST